MKKMINTEHISGYVYNHSLVVKQVQNKNSENYGKDFISGELNIATDEEGMNVIPVHFTFVTPTTKTGAKNNTYTALNTIIEAEGRTWTTGGKDSAIKVSVNTSIALNDFINNEGEKISVMRNEGGFVSIINNFDNEPANKRNTFSADMVIMNVKNVEANPDKGIEKNYDILHGAIFNFRGALLPVDFAIKDERGMAFFENQEISNSNPLFIKVNGRITNTTQVIEKVEESADWGESIISSTTKKNREWVVTGSSKFPYELSEDSNDLTPEELKSAIQDRELYWAEVKKRNDEYLASKQTTSSDNKFTFGSF